MALVVVATPSAAAVPVTAPARWVQAQPPASPGYRSISPMAVDAKGNVVLFDGSPRRGDTWTWNGTAWTEQPPSSTLATPPARSGHTMAYDAARAEVVLFGGAIEVQTSEDSLVGLPSSLFNDTWTWNGTTWSLETPTVSPPARYLGTMAYDAARGKVVLFGGNNGDVLADTWTWDGINWAQEQPATSPPARDESAMAYDAARGEVVLYGGWSLDAPGYHDAYDAAYADTWTWNGSTWARRDPPAPGPTKRRGHAMAYDPSRQKVVLFGGFDGTGAHDTWDFSNDTWAWDGTTWAHQPSPLKPRGRVFSSMAYHPGTQAMVLFGGMVSDGGLWRKVADTWVWTSAAVVGDFDGNGQPDRAVFRPTTGTWYVKGGATTRWGAKGDIPVPLDYDGNRRAEVAVFRPTNGTWYLQGGPTASWGTLGDIPVPADYNGDGKAELAVFRPSTGTWYVKGGATTRWGANRDIPVPADYNGDGKAELAVFRPTTGVWYVQGGATVRWGTNGDVPLPVDYNGDGRAEIAVFRPTTGAWYVQGGATTRWGTNGDIPIPGNYDADADAELAVFRPSTGAWYVQGAPTTAWGTNGDIPAPLAPSLNSGAVF